MCVICPARSGRIAQADAWWLVDDEDPGETFSGGSGHAVSSSSMSHMSMVACNGGACNPEHRPGGGANPFPLAGPAAVMREPVAVALHGPMRVLMMHPKLDCTTLLVKTFMQHLPAETFRTKQPC